MPLPAPGALAAPLATLALAIAGALAARAIGAPLPWMLGSMVAVAAVVLAGIRVAGRGPEFPASLRLYCVPVIGVLIGGALTPGALEAALDWWPAAAAMLLFVPAAHALNYLIFRRLGGYDRPTAFWSAAPGGLIESIELGTEAGGDTRLLTIQHFARIAVTVTAVPLIFLALRGEAVGSAAGVSLPGSGTLGPADALTLAAAAVVGGIGGRKIGLPAGVIVGPILVSGALHLGGITSAQPPGWIIAAAQLVIGLSLGLRFAGLERRRALRGLWLAGVSVGTMLALGAGLAALLAAATGQPWEVMLLCYAPGGIVEMGLVALSLHASPVFVTALHIFRILLTVSLAPLGWRRIARRDGA